MLRYNILCRQAKAGGGIPGGVAQLGACKIKSMPPMSNQQSTTSYCVPYKLPFLEEYGGIAQLGERLNGIQEVSGSIPLIFVGKQAFFLFCDEIGISVPSQSLPRGAFRVNEPFLSDRS